MRDGEIAKLSDDFVATVERTRCVLYEQGLKAAVKGWPAHREEPRTKIDG